MTKAERSIFHEADPEAETQDAAEAEADVVAGRVIPHDEVARWMRTWGTAEEGPPPESWGVSD